MESTSNKEELEYTSLEQASLGEFPSKDLEDSNSLHQERLQLDDKQSHDALKDLRSSIVLLEPSIQESVDSIKSTPDDPSFAGFIEKDLSVSAIFSELMSEKIDEGSIENAITSSPKTCSTSSPKTTEATVSAFSGETGLNEAELPLYPDVEPFSPDNDSAVIMEMSSEAPLSTLLTIFAERLNRSLEKTSVHPEKIGIKDLKDYANKELQCGLYILKEMIKRVDTSLKAANGLPHLGSSSFKLDGLNDAGIVLRDRLEALEAEATENYDRFISVCRDDSKVNFDVYDEELKKLTLKMISSSFIYASEHVLMLGLEIENFRSKIRELCSEFYELM